MGIVLVALFAAIEAAVTQETITGYSEVRQSRPFSRVRFGERRLELGDIIAACGIDDITFGVIIEMRSITDAQSFLADYLSRDFCRTTMVGLELFRLPS
jgi:hypothetical protein